MHQSQVSNMWIGSRVTFSVIIKVPGDLPFMLRWKKHLTSTMQGVIFIKCLDYFESEIMRIPRFPSKIIFGMRTTSCF